METIMAWQYSINKRFSLEDRTGSRWLKEFVYKTSSDSLKSAVTKKYDKLNKRCRGGVMYTFLVLREMFLMSKDVKKAILNFVDLFKARGLTRYTGESVLKASEELLGVLKRLHSVGGVTDEHVYDILQGLSICNNSRFKEMFSLLARNVDLGNVCILPTITKNDSPMEQIEKILAKAEEVYDCLCLAGQWNPAKKGGGGAHAHAAGTALEDLKCFNCEKKGCNVKKCPHPKDQAKIDRNFKAYREKNPKKPFKGKSSNPDAGGGNDDKNYRRKAWDSSGLTMVNGCLMAKCKTCGPNTTHTTKYHAKWAQNQGGFSLPDTHPYVKEKALLLGVPHVPPAPQNPPGPLQPPAQGAASAAGTVTFNLADLEAKAAAMERNSTDPNAASFAQMIREIFLN